MADLFSAIATDEETFPRRPELPRRYIVIRLDTVEPVDPHAVEDAICDMLLDQGVREASIRVIPTD